MFLLSALTAFAKPALVLILASGSLLATPISPNDLVVKVGVTDKAKVEKASALKPAAVMSTAATITLTGRIRNEEGKVLAGATVFLQGSDKAVSTDNEGKFSLEVPAAGKKTLRYGYGGYQDRDVVVGTSAPLTISLQPSPKTIELRQKSK